MPNEKGYFTEEDFEKTKLDMLDAGQNPYPNLTLQEARELVKLLSLQKTILLSTEQQERSAFLQQKAVGAGGG
ncbi:MAG: hypothetical protein H6774_01895 [Pseudomonadales bacterium]|nr:hypothetical protein [Candidatus Woesebacteria bacterium]MCB9801818.1 hypothetical protein [Pseudomonadales bacterium]